MSPSLFYVFFFCSLCSNIFFSRTGTSASQFFFFFELFMAHRFANLIFTGTAFFSIQFSLRKLSFFHSLFFFKGSFFYFFHNTPPKNKSDYFLTHHLKIFDCQNFKRRKDNQCINLGSDSPMSANHFRELNYL